jgi:hypothetical protein
VGSDAMAVEEMEQLLLQLGDLPTYHHHATAWGF